MTASYYLFLHLQQKHIRGSSPNFYKNLTSIILNTYNFYKIKFLLKDIYLHTIYYKLTFTHKYS